MNLKKVHNSVFDLTIIKRDTNENDFSLGNITYIVPATGNLADHFRKGVKMLEKVFQETYKEIETL